MSFYVLVYSLWATFSSFIVRVLELATPKLGDPYGTFHLSLNKLPGEDAGSPPKTEWLNMGYWKDTKVFPEACRALAIELCKIARVQPNKRILDVGHGSGESLVFLLTDTEGPRPSALTGITSLASHHKRSVERVSQIPLETPPNLYLGDAVYRTGVQDHPLDPSLPTEFDTIIALDCAYHFRTRDDFLRQCFVKLAPGGHIALADIVCRRLTPWDRLVLRIMQVMPLENCVELDVYEARLRAMGYRDIETRDITEDVFPGFVGFLKGRGVGWYTFAWLFEVLNIPFLRFVLVSAEK